MLREMQRLYRLLLPGRQYELIKKNLTVHDWRLNLREDIRYRTLYVESTMLACNSNRSTCLKEGKDQLARQKRLVSFLFVHGPNCIANLSDRRPQIASLFGRRRENCVEIGYIPMLKDNGKPSTTFQHADASLDASGKPFNIC